MNAQPHRSATWKRIGLITLKALGVIVAVVAVSVGGLMLVLQTGWGGERLRRQVVSRVNAQIQGQLAIGRLSFGGDRLVVWDVILRDPDGQLVAQVARAEVDLRPRRLIHKEVRVTAVIIESPRLLAVSDEKGLNLSRAVAPRKKAPPKPPAPPKTQDEGWVIQLDRFDLRDGDVQVGTASADSRRQLIHLANLHVGTAVRYATGNGSTDLTFGLEGQSQLAPVGPLNIKAETRVRGNKAHVAVDGHLLGGTLEARADVDGDHLEATDALLAIAIPRTTLAGFDWGPLRVDGRAHPGAVPTVDVSISIPGVALTAKGGGPSVFKLDGRLALDDLALTVRAAQALTGGPPPALSGHGQLEFTVEGPLQGMPASLQATLKGGMDRLRVGENIISDLSLGAHAAHLSRSPGEADLHVAIASVVAGTTKLGKIDVGAKLRARDVSAEVTLAAPEAVSLALAARLDDDYQGLTLSRFDLGYPRVRWALEDKATARFGDQTLSLSGFRLRSEEQGLAVDASKSEDQIGARLSLSKLRLDLLPALAVDPQLNLGGTLDLDVNAKGDIDNPNLTALLHLEQGRFRKTSKIDAKVDATLADHRVDGTLKVGVPFGGLDGEFHLPVNPLDGGALNVSVDVKRLDLADALRAAAMQPQVDGKLGARLRVTGDAGDPKVDLTINGRDLEVRRAATATAGATAIDVGHAAIHLTYENRAARADIDFGSAHGGSLRVEAIARIDLAYPRVTQGFVVKKMPVHGKVTAKDFDVAWIAQFNPQVETLGGQVNANAQLAGTVGDPQFVGDVRWKNGKVVATAPPPAAAKPARPATAPARPATAPPRPANPAAAPPDSAHR